MKNIRIFFSKTGALRFISHLDTARYFTRLARLAKLPLKYSEGFHSHLVLSLAMPLPLGFESEYEAADVVFTDDGFPPSEAVAALNAHEVSGFHIFNAAPPRQKPGKIAFCRYRIDFINPQDEVRWREFLSRNDIPVIRRGKKGDNTVINAAPKIRDFAFKRGRLFLTLSAGNNYLNPSALLNAFSPPRDSAEYIVTREMLLLDDFTPFA